MVTGTERILVWGSGAIGGTIGAYWCRAGFPVLFVDRDPEHVAAINGSGLRVCGPIEEFQVAATATMPGSISGEFEIVFLCVKAQDTLSAIDDLVPHLTDDSCVVSLQNGLNEVIIGERLGSSRTIGAFVNFGADYLSPGCLHYGGRGAVVIGELDGRTTPRILELHEMLRVFDQKAVLTANIWGYLWSKMAYAALLFATALTNASIADCFASLPHRAVFVSLAREVVAVAHAAGVVPESFDGFDPRAFGTMDERAASDSMDAMVGHNRRSAKTHSGIWRDLAVRKRRTEVDAQLGAVVQRAIKLQMPVPLVSRLIELVHDVENDLRPLSWETLDELARCVLPRTASG